MSSTTSKKRMMKIQKKEIQASQTNAKQNPDLTSRRSPLTYPKPMRDITNFGCVIKSWRLPSVKCPTASSQPPTFVELHVERFIGSFDLYANTWRKFPAFGNNRYKVTGHCSLTFTCDSRLQRFKMKDPYAPSQKLRLCNAVGFEGRFYGTSLQGSVVVIEKAGSGFELTTLVGGNRAVPSGASRHFREYMVLSNGEITTLATCLYFLAYHHILPPWGSYLNSVFKGRTFDDVHGSWSSEICGGNECIECSNS